MGMQTRVRKDQEKKRKGVHPVWRGIGCIMLFLILVMSYAGASLFVDANNQNEWIVVPDVIKNGPGWAPDLFMELLAAFFFALLGFGVFVVIYSMIYTSTKPPDILDQY
jgi:hypothetical protein